MFNCQPFPDQSPLSTETFGAFRHAVGHDAGDAFGAKDPVFDVSGGFFQAFNQSLGWCFLRVN